MIKEDAPVNNVGSGNIPGAGVAAAGKPANFGDAIVGSGAAKQWKKQNSLFRRKKPVMEDQIDELYGKGSVGKIRAAHYKQANDISQADEKRTMRNPNPAHRVNNPHADDAIRHHISKVRKADRIQKKINVSDAKKGHKAMMADLKEETFAGATVFEVNSKLFHNLTLAKRKGKHWRTYLEEDDCYAEIREWARKNPKGKIVVRNECTGEMRYVRY